MGFELMIVLLEHSGRRLSAQQVQMAMESVDENKNGKLECLVQIKCVDAINVKSAIDVNNTTIESKSILVLHYVESIINA